MIWLGKADLFAQQELTATLAFVKGEVEVNDEPVSNGQRLNENEVVITRSGSVTVLIGEETVIHIGENSEFELNRIQVDSLQNEQVDARLKYGKVRALVGDDEQAQREFEVRTRSSVMGIRGTHIFMNSPPNPELPVQFLTIEGEAVVRFEETAAPTTTSTSDRSVPGSSPSSTSTNTREVVVQANQIIEARADASPPSAQESVAQTVSLDQVQSLADSVAPEVGKAESIVEQTPTPTLGATESTNESGSTSETGSEETSAPPPPPENFFEDAGFDAGSESTDNPFDLVDQIETDITGEDTANTPEVDLDPTTDTSPPEVNVEIQVEIE